MEFHSVRWSAKVSDGKRLLWSIASGLSAGVLVCKFFFPFLRHGIGKGRKVVPPLL